MISLDRFIFDTNIITRREKWDDGSPHEITRQEVFEYVYSTPDLSIDEELLKEDRVVVRWVGPGEIDESIELTDCGSLVSDYAIRVTLKRMWVIAKDLNATLQDPTDGGLIGENGRRVNRIHDPQKLKQRRRLIYRRRPLRFIVPLILIGTLASPLGNLMRVLLSRPTWAVASIMMLGFLIFALSGAIALAPVGRSEQCMRRLLGQSKPIRKHVLKLIRITLITGAISAFSWWSLIHFNTGSNLYNTAPPRNLTLWVQEAFLWLCVGVFFTTMMPAMVGVFILCSVPSMRKRARRLGPIRSIW